MKLHGFPTTPAVLGTLLVAVAVGSGASAGEAESGSAAGPVLLLPHLSSEQSPPAASEQIELPRQTTQREATQRQATQTTARQGAEGPAARTRRAQHLLTELGFEPGPVDGKMGPKTRAAVRAFQRAHDLPDDGALSGSLLVAIEQATRAEQPAIEVQPLEATEEARAGGQSLAAEAPPSVEQPDKGLTLNAAGLVSSAEAAPSGASGRLSSTGRPRGPADAYGLDDAVVESWMIVKSLSGVLYEQIEARVTDALH